MRPPLPTLACALLLACTTKPGAGSEPAKAEPPAPALPASEVGALQPSPLDPSAPKLLIGDDDGLHEYDLDGKRIATLVTGQATMPRVLPDGRVVFLRGDFQGELALWIYTRGGEPKQLAALPQSWVDEDCKVVPGSDGEILSLHAPEDLRLDPAKQQACLRLQDYHDSMVNIGVMLSVSLVDGAIRQAHYLTSNEECGEDPDPDLCGGFELVLEPSPPAPSNPASFPYTFVSETSTVSGPGGTTSRLCAAELQGDCATVDSQSGSGRFELLSGQTGEGDHVHREVFMLDRQDGTLWAVTGEPPTMSPIEPKAIYDDHDSWWTAIGESDVRWLANDRLWLDGLLIDPATRRAVQLGGSLAFQR